MQKSLTAPGKGLLAIDESNATAGKLLHLLGSYRHHEVILPEGYPFVCSAAYTASVGSVTTFRMQPVAASMGLIVCNRIAAWACRASC